MISLVVDVAYASSTPSNSERESTEEVRPKQFYYFYPTYLPENYVHNWGHGAEGTYNASSPP